MVNVFDIYLTSLVIGIFYLVIASISGFGLKGLHGKGLLKHSANTSAHNSAHSLKLHSPKSNTLVKGKEVLTVTPSRKIFRKFKLLSYIGDLILAVFNPMGMSLFLTGFGLTGLIVLSLSIRLVLLSIILAFISGIIINRLFFNLLDWMYVNMEVNSLKNSQDLIGLSARVTLPISKSNIGEVCYTAGGIKYCKRAKIIGSGELIEKFAQVVICDIENDILLVAKYEEEC